MNRGRLLLGISLGLLVLLLSVTSFSGGFGFFKAPAFHAEVTLDTPSTTTTTPEPAKVKQPCNGKPGNPIVYYANDPSAAQHNNFGPPIDPRLSPLHEPYNPKPDTRKTVTSSWDRFCHDPALTRAVVAAAFPSWDKLAQPFDWMAALNKLATLKWNTAELAYFADPPNPWTMMMKHGKTANDPPATYITRAHYAGWYLRIAVNSSHQLLLRIGCGDQPSLDIRQGYNQAALTRIFQVA